MVVDGLYISSIRHTVYQLTTSCGGGGGGSPSGGGAYGASWDGSAGGPGPWNAGAGRGGNGGTVKQLLIVMDTWMQKHLLVLVVVETALVVVREVVVLAS